MAFYGFEHRYGANQRDGQGCIMGKLYVFLNRAARDRWIDDGNPYQTDEGARTVLRSKQAAKFLRSNKVVEVIADASVETAL